MIRKSSRLSIFFQLTKKFRTHGCTDAVDKMVQVKMGGICSEHCLSDYDPSYLMKRTLMSDVYVKPKLKPDAVPSRTLPSFLSR